MSNDFDFNIDLNAIEEPDNDFSPIEEGTYELAAEEWEQKFGNINELPIDYITLSPRVERSVAQDLAKAQICADLQPGQHCGRVLFRLADAAIFPLDLFNFVNSIDDRGHDRPGSHCHNCHQ